MRPFERADALQGVLAALLSKDPAARPDLVTVRARLAAVAGLPTPAPAAPPEPVAPAPAPQGPPTPEVEPDDAVRDERGGWGRWLVAAVVLLVVVVAVVLTGGDDPGDDPAPQAGQDAPEDAADDPIAEEEAPADETASPTDQEPSEPSETVTDEPEGGGDTSQDAEGTGGTVQDEPGAAGSDAYVVPETDAPGDWQVVEGETYRVAVPTGWERRDVEGNRTDWVDPQTGAYLRVDWTDQPASDPVADWEQAEAGFAQRQDGYERVRLDPARYRDWDAAMWEYTYRAEGADLHAVNLNVVADDLGHAFALNLQAPAAEWERVAEQFPAMTGSFEPTVGG